MATFLELCARLALESGAIGTPPSTVVGALPRRQAQCVNWIRSAWTSIQNHTNQWLFLRAEFEGALIAGQKSYTAADLLGVGAARFSEWVEQTPHAPALSLYDPAIGRKDEQWLRQLRLEQWRQSFDFGVHDSTRPTYWAVGYDGSLKVGQTPDKAYRVRGEYRKTPQVLAADNDVPEMPVRFHDAIWQRAIMLMAESDEAVQALQTAQFEYGVNLANMTRELLPDIDMDQGGAIDRR